MYKIVLIGAGQIGSRHLQALANISIPCIVQVVEPSSEATTIAKERYYQVDGSNAISKLDFLNSIDELENQIDVAIIATNADVRKSVISELIEKRQVKNLIIEKVVFQSLQDFQEMEAKFKIQGIEAWVNCPQREYSLYKELNSITKNSQSFQYQMQGGDWGMGCNTIHYMDNVAYLTGQSDLSLDTSMLDKELVTTKREGFIEITGTISGRVGSFGKFSFTSVKNSNAPLVISISTEEVCAVIFETSAKACIAYKESNWNWQHIDFPILYQSQLTNMFVEDILKNGSCDLGTFDFSFRLHKPLIQSLTSFISNALGKTLTHCPIT